MLGYRDASTAKRRRRAPAVAAPAPRGCSALADNVSDPAERENLREAAIRAAVVDTSWSAAFISYVVQQPASPRTRPVRQRPSGLYLRRIRDQRGRTGRQGRRTALSRVSDRHQAAPRRPDLPSARVHARRRQRRRGARAHQGRAGQRRRRALGPAHPLRRCRACRCAGAQGLHHRRQRQSGRHRQEAELRRRLAIFGIAKGPLRRQERMDAASGRGPGAARTVKCSLNERKWFVLLQVR